MKDKLFDIAVIGAGPAGCMAAISAHDKNTTPILIERNSSVGKKIYLTGKGRCNITNTASLDTFIEKFGTQGNFLRAAFTAFSNRDLMNFFTKNGLEVVEERQGRVFPKEQKARLVVQALKKALEDRKIDTIFDFRVTGIEKKGEGFSIKGKVKKGQRYEGLIISAKKVILSTGGMSFKHTGSTGDGFQIARTFGHKLKPLRPGLVPLRTKEPWVRQLQGLALKNVRVTFFTPGCKQKKIVSPIGEVMFTHFGISGPLVLDLSGEITLCLKRAKEIPVFIDLKPGLDREKLDARLIREFKESGGKEIGNLLKELLPIRLASIFARIAGINPGKRGSEASKRERALIVSALKAFPLTVTGALAINRGMVTGGGVSTDEIDSKTMESKIVPGIYFAGEVIDGTAPSGGYNLQQAFSTGYLAGEGAAI
ncbi:MAG: NAD(P)/FAD-dependent oxidoreductase [Candidatus Omnitrophica bacterium]|nr:NAD(P)/FAD-dependent oxidoreductase [Candidatus Omnitrophota bacterium]